MADGWSAELAWLVKAWEWGGGRVLQSDEHFFTGMFVGEQFVLEPGSEVQAVCGYRPLASRNAVLRPRTYVFQRHCGRCEHVAGRLGLEARYRSDDDVPRQVGSRG